MYSYHLSVLSFSLILIRVSISFQGSAQLSCSISQPTEKEILLPPSPFSLSQCAAKPLLASQSLFLFWKGLSGYKMSCTKSLNFLFRACSLEEGLCSNNSLFFFALLFFFFFYLFVLCFCHSDLICPTDSVVSPTFLLPAGKELKPGTDGCWWVCKAKLWFYLTQFYSFCSVL